MLILIMMRNVLKMNCIQCWLKKKGGNSVVKKREICSPKRQNKKCSQFYINFINLCMEKVELKLQFYTVPLYLLMKTFLKGCKL